MAGEGEREREALDSLRVDEQTSFSFSSKKSRITIYLFSIANITGLFHTDEGFRWFPLFLQSFLCRLGIPSDWNCHNIRFSPHGYRGRTSSSL